MIALVVAIYLSFLALNIWAILIRPARPWAQKFSMLLQIVGLYTFAFGVIGEAKLLPSDIANDLTSPDLFVFLGGNASALSLGSAAMSLVLEPVKTSFSPFAFLQLFGGLVLGAFSIVCIIFYAFVVAPLSYVAYVLASLPVSAITTSGRDYQFILDGQPISMKDFIVANSVAVKNFLIAFPSIALTMSLEIVTSFRTARRGVDGALQPDRPGWLTRHPPITRAVLVGVQAILGVLVFVLAVGGLMLPSLVNGEAGNSAPIGEIIGAEIVMGLVVWAFVVLLLKARARRKLMTVSRPAVETAQG